MGEKKYKVLIDDCVVAEGMTIATATILVKALFDEYYNEHSMIVGIQEMDRVEAYID